MKVALTGGVGSGKSTVAALLAQHGAVVVDADAIAREVVRFGTPGYDAVVARFGGQVIGPDRELDRGALGGLVFADEHARADLNAIVHPLVGARSQQLIAAAPPDAVVVYDVPLLVETQRSGDFDLVVVVEADERARLERLERRGLAPEQARARMAAQATDQQRRTVADVILRNDADRIALAREVDALWARLTA
jgi:dephospho-CoA kinase